MGSVVPKRTVGASLVLVAALILAGCTPFWVHTPNPTRTPGTSASATCPGWTTPPTPVAIQPPANTSLAATADYNAKLVARTPRPIRNLYQITQQLVKHLGTPVACRVRTSPRNDKVGQVTTFWVVNPSQSGYNQIQAKLLLVTPHLYMYVQLGASVDMSALEAAANRFETVTYVTDRKYFGNQWPGGPDDDPHITVLHATNLGPIGGYFSSEDEYPKSVDPYSNERQMIYINLAGGSVPGSEWYNATLAHEFQHMIHWYWHPADPSWTNEGMSVLAQHLNNFTSGGVDTAFLQQPDTMLGGWTDDQNQDVAHYGAGYLFLDYFAEHYGGYKVLRQLLTDPEQVPLNFDHVLAANGYHVTFSTVFSQFVMANLLNNPAVANGLYAYPTIPQQTAVPQSSVTTLPYADGSSNQPTSVAQYAAHYYDFQSGSGATGTLSVHFQGTPYVPVVPNTPYGGASAEWWSNSGNDMDTSLTRTVDLSSVTSGPITLTFAAWYNLEPDFDYGYVEVSPDGGKNWTTLRTSTSVSSNPNGSNYGNGMTGMSGGGSSPAWVPETVDLSAYAGKQVELRFETITDDAVHYAGMTVDNISIPQIGFSDTVASDNGWHSAGWIRFSDIVPQQFTVQAVVYTAGEANPQVQSVPVNPATGTADLSIAGFGTSVTRVTVAVDATAPATTVRASYWISAQLT